MKNLARASDARRYNILLIRVLLRAQYIIWFRRRSGEISSIAPSNGIARSGFRRKRRKLKSGGEISFSISIITPSSFGFGALQ